ncbi:MAG: PIN domain-containing protein [Nanoarchaeota archaeon]|nr:PIN domain-containing protein [Nanoarchaeota archaeon]
MELVVDANILFSALIKNNVTADILFDNRLKLYSPEFIIIEFMKYEDLILKKTKRTKEEFVQFMHQLKERIIVIPKEEYLSFFEKAKKFSPDKNDIMYFALALKIKCSLWSNDRLLKEQDKIKVYNTKDVLEFLNK